ALRARGIGRPPHRRARGATYHDAVRLFPILAGWSADLFLSILFSLVITAIVAGDGAAEAAAARIDSSIELQLSTLLVGLAFTGVGGYVAARLASERAMAHAVAVGLLSLGFGAAVTLFTPAEAPIWYQYLGLALTIPFAAFGGYYHVATARRAR
ncbi:MAG: hypothetical protein ACRDF0_02455, partial [Candidatus Limnocylindria bacterium]